MSPHARYRIGYLIVLLFAAAHLSVAARFAVHDVAKSPRWRVQMDYDDARDAIRAQSMAKYGARQNPLLPPGRPHAYLLPAQPLQRLLPAAFSTASRYTITLRLLSAVCFAASLVAFFALATSVFTPEI